MFYEFLRKKLTNFLFVNKKNKVISIYENEQ